VIDCDWWPDSAYEAVSRALADGLRPRALICLNDRVALGAYQALRAAGQVIPRDVSVLSFDDSDLAAWLRPQLTSISLPHYELGRQAVDTLLGPPSDPAVTRVPMPVRRRASIAEPAVD
jgi:LacI family transcriptional regulator